MDPAQVKNPEFGIAILQMALRVLEQQSRMQALAAMQQAQQMDAVARKVMRGH